ncbi:MAG: DUF1349 domain-containing protein [Verrucomicrobiota bacterium]
MVVLTGTFTLTAFAKSKGGIGSPKPEGSVVQSGQTWTVTGGGADIFGPSDQFHFVSNSASGNCTLTAKVMSVGDDTAHDWAKAALMIRADDGVGAPHASISVSHGGTIEFLTRNMAGGDTKSTAVPNMAAPVFLRIVRTGNDFAASYSQDGKQWTAVGMTMTVPMKNAALAGMAVTSHADGVACKAVFSNFVMKR